MRKRILIVDDEESVAFFLAENLAELGADYQVETANSGEEALAKMAAQGFDLLVTDLRMPGINGLELIEQARVRSPHTRLILMTAYGNTRVEATAYRLGACRYLAKPFSSQELVTAVQAALLEEATKALQDSLPEAPDPSLNPTETASAATVETFDLEQALKMGLLDPSWASSRDDGE